MPATDVQLEALYRNRYRGFVETVATVCGGYERVHDAVQEGFARALRAKDQFNGGSLVAWVMRIALNAALDTRRRARLDQPLGDDIPDAMPVRADRDRELEGAIRALPPKRRMVVFLRYFADLSYAEIAEVTGTSEGTVAATLHRAHAALREKLTHPQEIES
jgi:RNA polymerase sigma-70 factor (ECF subfamily)